MNGPARAFLGDVVGVKPFEAGKADHIGGIRVRGDTLSIRLTGVSGSFLSRLAMPFFCAVPIGTPVDPKGLPAVPSAGPYYIASYQPGRRLVLKRNPNYHGPRPHQLDELDIALNIGAAQAIKDVEAGRADYVSFAWYEQTPPGESARLAARYGAASPRGQAGKQQYFVSPFLGFTYLALNTTRPLFANARMRRAVNFAVDREALVQQSDSASLPTDQYLPPGMPGFRDAHIYPLDGPNLSRARKLAGPGRRTAVLYTSDLPENLKAAQILVGNLEAIGIHVEVDAFPNGGGNIFKKLTTKGEPWDIALFGWVTDGYPDPFDFLNLLLDGKLANTIGQDLSQFDDPVYSRRLEAAAKLTGAARYHAYARLYADLARNAAPLVAVANVVDRDFFSARMGSGCQKRLGMGHLDLAALCIRR
jgi:ABC-type oligopeptide transport system substrate-binding subunit